MRNSGKTQITLDAMEQTSEGEAHVPVLLISDDGEVKIEAISNENSPQIRYTSVNNLVPEPPNVFLKSSIEETFNSRCSYSDGVPNGKGMETLMNVDLENDVLEQYMEVCITYKCKHCNYTSDNQKEFQKHCLNHLLKTNASDTGSTDSTTYIYLCSNCSKAFNSAEETKEHMVKDHNVKNNLFGCDEVPEMIKTINVSIETEKNGNEKKEIGKKKRKLSEIVQSIDPSGNVIGNLNYFCRKRNCKYKFKNEKDLDIHEKCHLDSEFGNGIKRLYQCFQCNELFNGWHSCCSHLYKAHDIDCDLLKCPICETYKTSLPLRLENHIRIHSDVRAFTCKFCGKTFKQASQLRNHVVVHADQNGGQKPNWSRSKQCNICFKMYSDSKSLKKHKEEVHSKLRPFVCSVCGHASARKAMLLMHQRQHTGHKPYHCQLCTFKTADHNSLRKHLMRHTGVRPYKCPHCDYTAIQSGSYKNHMRIVHPNLEGMFMCSICHYRTISEDNYIRHISDHLTGLIKDNSVPTESTKGETREESHTTNFLGNPIFVDRRTEIDRDNTEFESTNSEQTECRSVDTGGITIPAQVTISSMEDDGKND